MKQNHLTLLVAIALLAACVTTFFACSQDEAEEQSPPQASKADILRAKAKELSLKYGIDMSLNEENINEIADTLTVEQLEKDFQMLASMSIEVHPSSGNNSSSISPFPNKRRLKIRSNKTPEEERDCVVEGNEDDIPVTIQFHKDVMEENGKVKNIRIREEGTAKIKWRYGLKIASQVNLTFESNDERLKGGGILQGHFNGGNNNGNAFTASGIVRICYEEYSIHKTATASIGYGKPTVSIS